MADEMNGEREAYSCCNTWFESLPEGRKAVLRDDKWMLAHAAFEAGRASLAANAPAATAADGKWYMLSRDGMATLCADRDDAMTEAASADKLYPNGAPHRALQLVAANAGSEPVAQDLDAWECDRCHGKGWHWQSESVNHGKEIGVENVDLRTHCDACEGSGWCGPDAQRAAVTPTSPPDGMVGGWMPIETAPKNGCTLLLGYFNSAGKWRTSRGQWMGQDYIDEYAEEPELMGPGWHETTVEDDDGKCWPIDPTHWMPLPPPPTTSADTGKGQS